VANDPSIRTRWSLVQRLKNCEDQESWKTFFETYWRLIYAVAVKSGLSDAEAQDVVQETTLSVVKQMPTFRADPQFGSFKSWLLNITRRRVVDQFRKRGRLSALSAAIDSDGSTNLVANIPDENANALERIWELEWKENIAQNAIENVRKTVSPKQFQIYELYKIRDWPVEKVTSFLKVTPNQVYIAKNRVEAALKEETSRLKKLMG
jgi:RNA polymerase sigma factor (sigma-70 family)